MRAQAQQKESAVSIKPFADHVVIKRIEGETTYKGTEIVIPDNAKEKPSCGEVIAIGPGRYTDAGSRIPMDVAVGDKVYFGKYAGTEVTIAGETYVVIRESELLISEA